MAKSEPSVSRDTTADETAIIKTIHKFLGCILSRDVELMHSLVIPHGSACLYRPHRAPAEEQPMIMTIKDSINRVFDLTTAEDEVDEQSFDEFVHIEDEGGIACVWSRYRFLSRGEVKHTGHTTFTMIKLEGKWLISGFADVARLL